MKICRRGLHQFEGRTCPECRRIKAAAWYAANREHCREISRKRCEGKTKELSAKKHEWCKRNPENVIWADMKRRCHDPKNRDYKNYGGRGIKVCERWQGQDGYKKFLADMGPRPSPEYQLDREDNNGNYEPANCHWTTAKRNNRNRRSSRMLTYDGRTQCIKDWAEELDIKYRTLMSRIYLLKWPTEKAFTYST